MRQKENGQHLPKKKWNGNWNSKSCFGILFLCALALYWMIDNVLHLISDPNKKPQRRSSFPAATCIDHIVKGVFKEKRLCTDTWQLQPDGLFEVESLQTNQCTAIYASGVQNTSFNVLFLFLIYRQLKRLKQTHWKDSILYICCWNVGKSYWNVVMQELYNNAKKANSVNLHINVILGKTLGLHYSVNRFQTTMSLNL